MRVILPHEKAYSRRKKIERNFQLKLKTDTYRKFYLNEYAKKKTNNPPKLPPPPANLNDSIEVVEIPSNHRHQNEPNVSMRHIFSFHVYIIYSGYSSLQNTGTHTDYYIYCASQGDFLLKSFVFNIKGTMLFDKKL